MIARLESAAGRRRAISLRIWTIISCSIVVVEISEDPSRSQMFVDSLVKAEDVCEIYRAVRSGADEGVVAPHVS